MVMNKQRSPNHSLIDMTRPKTSLQGEVCDEYGLAKERLQVWNHAVESACARDHVVTALHVFGWSPAQCRTCLEYHEMADDLTNRGAQDRSRINVNEKHEVRYWAQKWGSQRSN